MLFIRKNLWRWAAFGLLGIALVGIALVGMARFGNNLELGLPSGLSASDFTTTGGATSTESTRPHPLPAAVTDAERSAFWGADWQERNTSIEEPASSVKWFEGEHPARSNFPNRHSFMPQNETEASVLSGGNWLGTEDSRVGQFAEYEVSIPESGTYAFYARKFWRHGPFRYRFDQSSWVEVGDSAYILEEQPLRKHVVASWIALERVTLTAGEHLLRLELTHPGTPAAFDAFVLSLDPFVPRGKLRPDQLAESDDANWFVFDPRPSDQSTVLDFAMTPTPAGEQGFLQTAKGRLRFADGTQDTRFWGVNASHEILDAPPELHAQYAKHLAKWGVNLLRLHGSFASDDIARVDQRKLDQLFSLHDALRRQGVYLALSIYFPLWHKLRAADGFDGYDDQHPFALPFFNRQFSELQQGWWRELLTTRSPLTRERLVDDASLAFVEIVNEDSTLFWTFSPYDSIPAPQMESLERRFWHWLMGQGEDVHALIGSGKPVRGDDLAEHRAGVMPLSELLQRRDRRAQRTAFFLADIMREYYAQQVQFLAGLGYRALTVCSNWHTADEMHLGLLDNWANLPCDVMDRHGYFSGSHTGDAAAYSIEVGQSYMDRSVLTLHQEPEQDTQHPALPPFLEPRFNEKPSIVSELGWPGPNRFRAEGPLLTAAYGALHDLDAVAWFAASKPTWPRLQSKFEVGDPAGFGHFAAAARIFRMRLVDETAPVARARVPLSAMSELKASPIQIVPRLDKLRDQGIPARVTPSSEHQNLDPMWLLVGPVDLHLGQHLKENEHTSVSLISGIGETPWATNLATTVVSRNEQLVWNYATGVVTLAAPQAQFAVGFVSRMGRIVLPDFAFESANEYAQVALVSLDGQPLQTSSSLLLSVGTEARNAGFRTQAEPGQQGMRRITAVGHAPILVRNVEGRVLLLPPREGMKITPLDPNGVPLGEARPAAEAIPLLPDVLHYHLTVPQ